MAIARYPGIEADGDRPLPGDRIEEYNSNDWYRAIWESWPTDIEVARVGDDTCRDDWQFAVERVGEKPPYDLRIAPKKHVHTRLDPTAAHDVPVARRSPPQRRMPTKSRTVELDEVPDAVLDYIEQFDKNNDYLDVEVTGTLG